MTKLDEILIPISEALLNIRSDYPNRDKANHAFGQLTSFLHYMPTKAVIVLDETTGICTLKQK